MIENTVILPLAEYTKYLALQEEVKDFREKFKENTLFIQLKCSSHYEYKKVLNANIDSIGKEFKNLVPEARTLFNKEFKDTGIITTDMEAEYRNHISKISWEKESLNKRIEMAKDKLQFWRDSNNTIVKRNNELIAELRHKDETILSLQKKIDERPWYQKLFS